MSDVTDLDDYAPDEFGRQAAQQRAAEAWALRDLADRIELLRGSYLVCALPIAVWGVHELEQRLTPWLR